MSSAVRVLACALAGISVITMCRSSETLDPIDVSMCELYQNPEQYSGKIVRVRAGSTGELQIENILHDSPSTSCPAYMRILVVFPKQVIPPPGFDLVKDESYKDLDEALHTKGPIRIDATYEGRFDAAYVWRNQKRIRLSQGKEKGYGKNHDFDARIVLRRVLDVWSKRLPPR